MTSALPFATSTVRLLVALLVCACAIVVAQVPLDAAGPAKAVAQSITKRLAGKVSGQNAAHLWRAHLARDRRARLVTLTSRRTVYRYVSGPRAGLELRRGLRSGAHLTARGGRLPHPDVARRTFGLPNRPAIRETIRLPKGTSVRYNRATGGHPGIGEITSPNRIPATDIVRLRKLH